MHDTVFVCAQSDVGAADRAAADFHTRRIREDVVAFETRAVGDALHFDERFREDPVNSALHLPDDAFAVGGIDLRSKDHPLDRGIDRLCTGRAMLEAHLVGSAGEFNTAHGSSSFVSSCHKRNAHALRVPYALEVVARNDIKRAETALHLVVEEVDTQIIRSGVG